MASWGLRSARPAGGLVGALLVVLVSGCATAPSGGAPQRLEGQGGQQESFVQPLPPPGPNPRWNPSDVVQGFLAASANFELDPAAARAYLAPHVPLPWSTNGGQPPVVTVVNPTVSTSSPGPTDKRISGGPPMWTVKVTGQRLATLSSRGDYLYLPGTETYTFQLGDYNGQWLIQQLPGQPGQNPLLLSETEFEQVFQPRNLYFFGPQDGPSQNYLVPDPVFVPLEAAGATDASSLATELVQGLLHVPGSQATWLSQATYTGFPLGATLAQPGVTISNLTARVSLVIPGASTPAELSQMYAQLDETLTSSAYSPPIVQHVQLVVNGKVEHVGIGPANVPAIGSASANAAVDPLYFAAPGLVYSWSGGGPSRVLTPDLLPPTSAITAVAASPGPNPNLAVAVPYRQGCEVFVGRADEPTRFEDWDLTSTGGVCSSLSWDNGSDLWMVAGSDIWVLQFSTHYPVYVQYPAPVQVDPPTNVPKAQVLALRIAPDGVRAALLVRTGNENEMLLAAVTYSTGNVTFASGRPVGTDVVNPTAISWYKPDDLIALAGSDLWEVPLTGGQSSSLTYVPSGTVAISTAGSNALAIRTAAGQVYTSPTPGDAWKVIPSLPTEAGPDYPG
jgi:hypothetical protein